MQETSLTLLNRVKGGSSPLSYSEAWINFLHEYRPIIRSWLRSFGAAEGDVEEIQQEVALVLLSRIDEFERRRTGSFRRFLKKIAWNCTRDCWRRNRRIGYGEGGSAMVQVLHQIPASASQTCSNSGSDRGEEIQRALTAIRPEFRQTTWSAFQLVALENHSISDAAARLKITPNAVTIAKSRVLKRLRESLR